MNTTKKRKLDSDPQDETGKRLKVTTASGSSQAVKVIASASTVEYSGPTYKVSSVEDKGVKDPTPVIDTTGTWRKRPRINKLAAPRPFPTVPTSVSATGPRSAHKEGKNYICLTRKTPLGSYMRRCKDVIIKDGYKTLHLSAMGAAIPHLLHLALALPPILPFAADEIRSEVTTGTVEVQDEIIPEDEDEDISYKTRGKSTLMVVIKIGDGESEGDRSGSLKRNGRNKTRNNGARSSRGAEKRGEDEAMKVQDASGSIVFQEPEQESMEML